MQMSYFGRVDHCCRIGLCVVTTCASTRLVTSDQLQKQTFTDKAMIYCKRKLLLLAAIHHTTKQPMCTDLI